MEANPPADDRAPPPDPIRSPRGVEEGRGRIETRQLAVHDVAEPLTAIRETFAENWLAASAAPRSDLR